MKDLLRRIEALEARSMSWEPRRVVIQLIEAKDGHALPWNPTRATCAGQTIGRNADETAQAFEARALASFPTTERIIIGA